ncbi:hypothetical protein HF086_014391 [Spodoptera exigua]|uniref:MADF domain-containing protein n=1 Tax=Spodoptera exigua TaxID=7107 RepID=A0A922SMI8_SPOEX|nr:hypothetical protein HF086_014391 [Spodoptera exigua]
MMSTDPIPHFDVDAFISDVEERPAIWDLKSDLYSDRGKKTEAWEELCLKFIPNFSEKNVAENKAASQLQRKWKSLRDCFKREHSKQMSVKSGSASSSRKPYIYYQQLSFLKNLADTRRDPSPLPNEVHDATERKRPKKNKTNNEDIQAETDILVSISEQLQSRHSNKHEEDADHNFALSLVPHFKQIPNEFKLDAQTDVLMEPRSYHTMQPSTSGYQPTPRPSALGYQSASRPPSMGYQSNFEHDFSVTSPSASDNTMNSVLSDDINEHLFDN